MLSKFALKFFIGVVCFSFMFLLGVGAFNLFHVKEKLRMLEAINAFHSGQINNDKKLIDNSLTDNFTETGVRRFVQTPEAIYKSDLMNFDYSKVNLTIEAKYPILLSMFSNSSTSLSFVRKLTILPESGITPISISFYVTYTFENCADGLKINKIERKL